ncbi:MAG: hypothetical protein HC800_09960 [Phormidesmis sp. RL_2_1]|nr:hypothetical protein [Phormidesmis sp. RL_2_1]
MDRSIDRSIDRPVYQPTTQPVGRQPVGRQPVGQQIDAPRYTSSRAPTSQMNWYSRVPMLPRIGDVIPYGQYLFSVTTVILEDCCSADAIYKVDKQASRIAEREEVPKWDAVVWVSFWGMKSY